MRKAVVLFGALAMASAAHGQAVTGFTGGTLFDIFYGGSTGDVVGWRFTVNQDIFVTDLGVYNADSDGLTTSHQVGIWDSAQNLLASVTVAPGDTPVGLWTYASIPDLLLTTGETYTIGAMYASLDGDAYISGASSMTTSPDVNWVQSVHPSTGNLGFVYPETNTTSFGRFGPNFLYVPVPTPGAAAVLGLGGLLAARRRR